MSKKTTDKDEPGMEKDICGKTSKMRSSKLKSNLLWQYFKKDSSNRSKVSCRLCTHVKVKAGKEGMRNHMEKTHTREWATATLAENVEKDNHHVLEGNFESVQERAELFESGRRSPLASIQASASGSRWGKFLPSSTSAWEEEEDDLEEEIQGFGLSGKWHSWGGDENGPEEQEDEHHGVPSKRSKSHVGKRKAIDAHAGNSFSSAGNVPSKWGKFSS